jgi:hypothetical protein
MSDVIAEPRQVTPQRLTNALRRSYDGWRGCVSSVSVASTKTLQYSRIAHLDLEYSDEPHDLLPERVFLKLSPLHTDPGSPESAGSEIRFYNSVAAEMRGPPLIWCYDAAFSAKTGSTHLLLEDLSASHFQTGQGKHPAPLYSELAVKCLARFHAYWWDHPKLGNGVGDVFDDVWLGSFLADLETSVTKFVDFLRDSLAPERRRAYERMLRSSRIIWGRLTEAAGLTVAHGDMHWWNFLHPNDPDIDQTRIFDWQLWHIDLGPRDLAFLIALGGFAERRPELEAHLLRTYHEELVRCGVRNYSWSRFEDDYRWSAIRNLNIPVIFWSEGKHMSTWGEALERAFQSYNELKCGDLL